MSNWVPLRLRNLFIKFIYFKQTENEEVQVAIILFLLIALCFDKLGNNSN